MHKKAVANMESGIAQGFEQLSLACFTTLAPSAVVAFILLTFYGIVYVKDEGTRKRLHHFLIIPLIFCLIGLIASTNHLGKPSNALYVLAGVGRSPLSNEVAASVAFTGIAWIYWLAGFSERISIRQLRGAIPFAVIAGIAQIWFTSNAYSIATIASWSLVFTQVNQILSALLGGSFLFLFTLAMAHQTCEKPILQATLLCAGASTLVLLVSELLQSNCFRTLSSTTSTLTDTFAYYPAFIAVATLLLLAACVSTFFWSRTGTLPSRKQTSLALTLTLCGIFLVRFSFYCAYLNVGLVM